MKKAYKTITQENGVINIYGNNKPIQIEYSIPEWSNNNDEECCFKYKGNIYFLSEFMRIEQNSPFYTDEGLFHGYYSDSFFSGVLVYISDCGEYVKAYTYIS